MFLILLQKVIRLFSTNVFLRLSIDNANHHLWIRVENQLYVAKIEEATNTLYLLEWDNNSNLSTYWTQQKPVIYEGKAWITTDKKLLFN